MTECLKHVISYSGGIGSWATTKRVLEREDVRNVILVFIDTHMEDEDCYRFVKETVAAFGCQFVLLEDGRTPWQVFHQQRMLGSSRVDICTRILKRELFRRWLTENFAPESCYLYLGIDWSEIHRYERAKPAWLPWRLRCPMTERPYQHKAHMFSDLAETGITPPRLYTLGFPHNNCGGFCVKAGRAHFGLLKRTLPERFEWHAQQEQLFRLATGRDVAILTEKRQGRIRPVTLRELGCRIDAGEDVGKTLEWGGCGCMTDIPSEEQQRIGDEKIVAL